MGPGPDAFNDDTVARCTWGLIEAARGVLDLERGVVIGRDARIDSDRFARVAAEVVAAADLRVVTWSDPVPTPLVAFAVRRRGGQLGIMVTASHNPPLYNGLKVFGPEGAQIVPPFDEAVERAIASAPAGDQISRIAPDPIVAAELEAEYLEALGACRRTSGPLGVRAVYSPLHGVGARLFGRLAEMHGLELSPVPAQLEPDGRFPTTPSPNPEDPAALEAALRRARDGDGELMLVHDPDADRLAVAVAHRGDWVVLTGDQIGVLLADHRLSGPQGGRGAVVLSTVVSSRMIEALAAARGAESRRTPTGFKWMARVAAQLGTSARVELAYEQALGFSVADVVRDKDGLGAALAIAEAVRVQRDRGFTLIDRWLELEAELGAHRTESVTLAWAPGEEAAAREAFERYRSGPPLAGPDGRPGRRVEPPMVGPCPADLVFEEHGPGTWVAVRPSGTEPKLKVYIEAHAPPGPDASSQAAHRARRLRDAVRTRLAEGR